jgi:gliding motility-associated-like protein
MVRDWLYLLLCFLFVSNSLTAAHLVGGEISYTCLGNNQYQIKLTVYRDCQSQGAAFDPLASVSIYDGTQLTMNLQVPISSSSPLPVTAPNSCTTLPPFVCTEKAVYLSTQTLPPSANGYTISYQRCCRNGSINNLPSPGTVGNTFTVSIPPNDIACNSSPDFSTDPPIALCLNVPSTIDMSTNEVDGDSVVYSLCRLLNGGGPNSQGSIPGGPNTPAPNPATPPPYSFLPFSPGFTASNPITSVPSFSIDARSGLLSGTPTQVGQYVFAICAREYRNGNLLSTVRRDFQFNVTSACRGVAAVISGQDVDSSTLCTGRTVTFRQNSINATTFLWDFGDPNLSTDTSSQPNPTYTYQDTGLYQVTLVADPGFACSDTSYSLYRIFNPITAQFTYNKISCFEDHNFNFTVSGDFSDSAQFYWRFGGTTNLGDSSRIKEPNGVLYNEPGIYVIQLRVEDFECVANYSDTLKLFTRPRVNQEITPKIGCRPTTVFFTDSSEYLGLVNHYWDFGDGSFSTQKNTQHTYEEAGLYTITHKIITKEGCIDTAEVILNNHIRIHPLPMAGLSVNPQVTDIYNPVVTLADTSAGRSRSLTTLPNGRELENITTEAYTFTDTGQFKIRHVVYNEFGCSDTVWVPVLIEQPVNFYIPNAFTPNNDGINDEFSFVVTGVSKLNMSIYNRWGELVFNTNTTQGRWNGKDQKTGKDLPPGVYTYICVGRIAETGVDEKKTGFIKLLR